MLGIYYARRFLVSFFRVFLVVAGLIFVGDFIDNIRDYSSFDDGLKRAAIVASLHVPSLMTQALPIIAMLAGISFSVGLARFNEFIISRAAGQSALRSLTPTLATATLLGVLTVIFFDPFAGYLLNVREDYKNSIAPKSAQTISVSENGYWMRQTTDAGHMILWAKSAEDNGQVLRDVTALTYDDEGRAVGRFQTNVAFLKEEHWIFAKGKEWNLRPEIGNPELSATTFNLLRVPTSITPEQILDGFPNPETLSLWTLPSLTERIERAGFSALNYKVYFQTELARPLLFLAMVAVGMMFTLQNARLGNMGTSILLALCFGFALHFLQNFAKTLGNAGEIAIPVAAWFPPVAACLLALSVFLHLEDG